MIIKIAIRFHRIFYDFLIDSEIGQFYASILNLIVVSLIVLVLVAFLNFLGC